jgi:hypothetical protein
VALLDLVEFDTVHFFGVTLIYYCVEMKEHCPNPTELDNYDIHQCHQLLIPINIGNNHWILAQLRNLQKISKDFFKIRAKSVTLP